MLATINAVISIKKYLLIIISSIILWVSPISSLLFLIIGSVFLDTIFGVYASYKLGKPILSRKFQRIVVKCLLYCSSFLLFYGIDYLILNDILSSKLDIELFLSKLVAICFILIELFSIDEKIRAINKGKGFSYFIESVYKYVLNIKRKISSITENSSPL